MNTCDCGHQPKVIWLCPPGGAVTLDEVRLVEVGAVVGAGSCLVGGGAGGGASCFGLGCD